MTHEQLTYGPQYLRNAGLMSYRCTIIMIGIYVVRKIGVFVAFDGSCVIFTSIL